MKPLYGRGPIHLDFLWLPEHLLEATPEINEQTGCAILFSPNHEAVLDRLANELQLARAVTGELFSRIAGNTCRRLPLLNKAGKSRQFDRLIEAEAWTDAALALIELEPPGWKLRRLAYEDGQWICSLSRQPNLPAQIDDTVDSNHEVLALALLSAFVEARRATSTEARSRPQPCHA
jgi:hypothetical protein